ncbi:MAG: DUF1326 domain-containing protein [Acidobacteriia bacterium]|nr:DUF1326 domain-containing protein [Terriglobia bacterium]
MAQNWWAKGLIFENCNCQLVCPGHMHFDQLCTHERCIGYWAIRIDSGQYGDVSLAGLRAVIAFDTPQHMISGGWTEMILIDEASTQEQRAALQTILAGQAGGPWETLGRFVARRLDIRYVPIDFNEDEVSKSVTIPGLLKSVVTRIRGRDRSKPVLFENIFNQIHAPTQVLATGDTEYDDGVIRVKTAKSHGLFSNFEWRVEAS